MKALAAAAIVAFSLASVRAAPLRTTLRGYSPIGSEQELATESQFIDIPSAQSALDSATAIGARPHYAGTAADYALAVFMRDRMRAYGIATELESFAARVDTPRELVLEVGPSERASSPGRPNRRNRHAEFPIALDLAEAPEPSDPATAARNVGLPFNSGSGDGDVSAPLVYADRGLDDDYETLAQAHVEVRGAVVLVRYGAEFRGRLAERAQTRGAAGLIFYSDPKDDGFARGLVYPKGPWRPLTAIARGWVGNTIHIPTLPISAANARILLDALRGPAGPAGWGGALPVAYPLARGPGRVHLIVKLNRKTVTLWNTVGVVPGVQGDQSVILGAHRDAWVYGAAANGDGVATMLEVARGLGFLLQGGWRPQRTIVIAGWDGAEAGWAGSRAYARRHRVDLQRGCFAYLNADENVTGPALRADAVAAIAPFLVAATRLVRDPVAPAGTVYDRWAAQTARGTPLVDIPEGAGDDGSFLAEAGTPVANLDLRGPFGVENSSYDTVKYATLFSDPDFTLHRTAAQLYGFVALRLADAAVVPYTFTGYVTLLRRGSTRFSAQAAREEIPFDTAALGRAIARLASAAQSFEQIVGRADPDGSGPELRAARELDSLVYGIAGYAGPTLTDIDSALAAHDAARLNSATGLAAAAVDRAADELAGRSRI